MSHRDRGEFPAHWDPPPRLGYAERKPSVINVLLQTEAIGTPWVQELYREKLAVQACAGRWDYNGHAIRLREMDDETLARYVSILESLPERSAMAVYHEREIHARLDPEQRGENDFEYNELSDNRRASLEAILNLIPKDQLEAVD
jgi:hypothetical protein